MPNNIPKPGASGVKFTTPPETIIPKVMGDIEKAISTIGANDFALVAVADRQGGWNSAAVVKGPKGVKVMAWIGKSWGDDQQLDWGAQLLWSGTFKEKK